MVTTIKIHDDTKKKLERFRKSKESYNTAIERIISKASNQDVSQRLKEAYIAMSKDQFEEFKEWDNLDL